jgi:hypothetical protein
MSLQLSSFLFLFKIPIRLVLTKLHGLIISKTFAKHEYASGSRNGGTRREQWLGVKSTSLQRLAGG